MNYTCPLCGGPRKQETKSDLPITYLPVSAARKLRLIEMGIYTVGQLFSKTDQELLKYRGMGPHTLQLLKKAMESFKSEWKYNA